MMMAVSLIIETVKGLLLKPRETFEQITNSSLTETYQQYVLLLIIYSVLMGLVSAAFVLLNFIDILVNLGSIPLLGPLFVSKITLVRPILMNWSMIIVYLLFLFLLFGDLYQREFPSCVCDIIRRPPGCYQDHPGPHVCSHSVLPSWMDSVSLHNRINLGNRLMCDRSSDCSAGSGVEGSGRYCRSGYTPLHRCFLIAPDEGCPDGTLIRSFGMVIPSRERSDSVQVPDIGPVFFFKNKPDQSTGLWDGMKHRQALAENTQKVRA